MLFAQGQAGVVAEVVEGAEAEEGGVGRVEVFRAVFAVVVLELG